MGSPSPLKAKYTKLAYGDDIVRTISNSGGYVSDWSQVRSLPPEHKNKTFPKRGFFVFTAWQGEKTEDTKVSEAGSKKFSAENYP
jgi:hypothetical protein